MPRLQRGIPPLYIYTPVRGLDTATPPVPPCLPHLTLTSPSPHPHPECNTPSPRHNLLPLPGEAEISMPPLLERGVGTGAGNAGLPCLCDSSGGADVPRACASVRLWTQQTVMDSAGVGWARGEGEGGVSR